MRGVDELGGRRRLEKRHAVLAEGALVAFRLRGILPVHPRHVCGKSSRVALRSIVGAQRPVGCRSLWLVLRGEVGRDWGSADS